MTINEFSKKAKLSPRDKRVVTKLYAGLDKTQAEWEQELKGKVVIRKNEDKKAVKPKTSKAEVLKKKIANKKETKKS